MKLSDLASASASVSVSGPPDANAAIAQGNAIYDQASSIASQAANGDYGAIAAAATAIAGAIPPGKVGNVAKDAIGILEAAGEGAAAGAAIGGFIGTIIPGLGTAIGGGAGAEVGAAVMVAVQFVEDIWPAISSTNFNPIDIAGDLANDVGNVAVDALNVVGIDKSNPPQNDFRYSSEKICFPAFNSDSPYGVIPGVFGWTPRCNPDSDFYQTPSLDVAHSMLFTFLVGWVSPHGTTPQSPKAAFLLAQYYTMTDSATTPYVRTEKGRAASVWSALVALLGAKDATAALARLERWYGKRNSFSITPPFAANKCHPPSTANTVANVELMKHEFAAFPFDYLYYPIQSRYDKGSLEFVPTSTAQETDCMMVPDTLLIALAEDAVLKHRNLTVFHNVLAFAHKWKLGRTLDAKKYPGLSTANHPNFSRCLGLIAYELRKEAVANAPKPRAKTPAVPSSTTSPAPSAAASAIRVAPAPSRVAAATSYHRVRDFVVAAGVAVAAGGLVAWMKSEG